jgi:hypothetical protein
MAAQGSKPSDIADYLNNKNVPTPMMYRCQSHPHLNPDDFLKRQEWTSATLVKMLRNTVYLGIMSQSKTTKVSFKSNLTITNPKEAWIIVENTHEPIISNETFEIVQRYSQSRTCTKKGRFANIFSGIAKCADCGKNMSSVGSRKKDSPVNLACGSYKLYGSSECSNHFIDYNTFYDIVFRSIQEQMHISEAEKKALVSDLQKEFKNNDTGCPINAEVKRLEKRKRELDGIIEKLYEDNYQGVINDDRFKKLLDKYEAENISITEKLKFLSKSISDAEDMDKLKQSYEQFLSLVKEYTEIQTLSADFLIKFIDRIEVEQGHYEKAEAGKVKRQKIRIYFRFIGKAITKECTV